MKIRIRTSDKQIIYLEDDILSKMKLLQRFVESERESVETDEITEDLPFLHSAEYNMIKQWCDLDKNDLQEQQGASKDKAFFEHHRPYVLNILDVAFKLEIDDLMDACILFLDEELQKGNLEEA